MPTRPSKHMPIGVDLEAGACFNAPWMISPSPYSTHLAGAAEAILILPSSFPYGGMETSAALGT